MCYYILVFLYLDPCAREIERCYKYIVYSMICYHTVYCTSTVRCWSEAVVSSTMYEDDHFVITLMFLFEVLKSVNNNNLSYNYKQKRSNRNQKQKIFLNLHFGQMR